MNFQRGLDPKVSMNIGIHPSLDIEFIGCGPNQPHNRSMIEKILNNFSDKRWDDHTVFYAGRLFTSNFLFSGKTSRGFLYGVRIKDLKRSDIKSIQWNKKYYIIK